MIPFLRYEGRWVVVFDPATSSWCTWVGGRYVQTIRHFPTHAEAIAYADLEARRLMAEGPVTE